MRRKGRCVDNGSIFVKKFNKSCTSFFNYSFIFYNEFFFVSMINRKGPENQIFRNNFYLIFFIYTFSVIL